MKKRILSFVLVLSLISSMIMSFPITANAETVASGTCGANLTWTLDYNGTLTISGTGNMMDYPLSDSPWRKYRIENIIIDEGVTSIGYCTFGECYSLTSITIPSSVTSISERAFPCYSKLTSINVDKDNENYCSVDGILFNKTKTKLIQYPSGKSDTKYTIPNSVTSIEGWVFESCTSLTSITIPDSVTSIGSYAFYCCTSLTNVTIPNSVTSIGGATFDCCTSMTSITIPDSVTNINSAAFRRCIGLTSVTIPDRDCDTIGLNQ